MACVGIPISGMIVMCVLAQSAGAQPTAASAPATSPASAHVDGYRKGEADQGDLHFERPPFPSDASTRRNGRDLTKEAALKPVEPAASPSKPKSEEVKNPCGPAVRQECRSKIDLEGTEKSR